MRSLFQFTVLFVAVIMAWLFGLGTTEKINKLREEKYQDSIRALLQCKHEADSVNERNKGFLDSLDKILHKDNRYKNWMVK